jgi:hypothetical protein
MLLGGLAPDKVAATSAPKHFIHCALAPCKQLTERPFWLFPRPFYWAIFTMNRPNEHHASLEGDGKEDEINLPLLWLLRSHQHQYLIVAQPYSYFNPFRNRVRQSPQLQVNVPKFPFFCIVHDHTTLCFNFCVDSGKGQGRNPEAFRDPVIRVSLPSAFQSLIGPQTWQSTEKGHEGNGKSLSWKKLRIP